MTFAEEIAEGRAEELRCQAKQVGRGLRALRKMHGIAAAQMCKAVGVSAAGSWLRNVENGWRHSSYEHLRAFAEALGFTSVSDLVAKADLQDPGHPVQWKEQG